MEEISEELKEKMDKFFIKEEPLTEEEKQKSEVDMVIEAYQKMLGREPDIGGLKHYSNMLKYKAITVEKLYEILKNSDEYKEKVKAGLIPLQETILHNAEAITYCMMGTNRLHEIKDYIPTILPYIDKFIFIDGDSEDGTVDFLNKLSKQNDNKIEVHIYEWQDRFSEQRNHYLEKVKDGWVICSDTDEHFPVETLKELRNLVKNSEKENYNGIMFQVEDITVDDNDFNKIISRNINNYWKSLMFKYHPDIHYEGEPHETLIGERPFKWKRTNLIYEHYRSPMKVYMRATENFFISNSNRYSEKWAEFRWLCTKNELLTFKDFFKLYREGNLPKEIEEWIYNHKDDNENAGDSEVREMYKLYQILHPDKLATQTKIIAPSTDIQKTPFKTITVPITGTTGVTAPEMPEIKVTTTLTLPEENLPKKKEPIFIIEKLKCAECYKDDTLLYSCYIDPNFPTILCKDCWKALIKAINEVLEEKK